MERSKLRIMSAVSAVSAVDKPAIGSSSNNKRGSPAKAMTISSWRCVP